MKIKEPVCLDVSHWKEILDFKLVDPKPVLFITKASEAFPGTGWNHTDDKFIRFFEGMMEIEVIRGAYHFFRKSLDAVNQAKHFISVISQVDILSSDILILDVEEGGERASQLWAWFEYVKRYYPDNLLMIYSRKNILDPIYMTPGEKGYFKEIPTWPAGYPYFPDLYSKIPSGYIPDQTKWGPSYLWQYSAHGKITGIIGDADLNWINPVFNAMLGTNQATGETMASFSGKCINWNNKVWKDVGMQQIGSVPMNAWVSGEGEKTVAGVAYIRLTVPLVGWTKKQWFSVAYEAPPPPPPPPPPPEPEPEPEPIPEPTFPPEFVVRIGTVEKTYILKP